ncbi:MAG: hypothetical protein JNK48_27235 [Bryobacterales bacterium]|nr:hypothetical protein [Bryobacterales bacterium]
MSEDFQELLSSVKHHVPVIVVVRVPDTREWIAAMEAGAADYCAPPFESAQLRWMLSTASQGGSLLRAAG